MRSLLVVACAALFAFPSLAQDQGKKLQQAADAAVQQKDWATAAASFRKLTELQPENGKAWHMLGYTLHADGKLDEALKVHIKATTFPDVAPVSAYNAACVYSLQDNKDEAFAWLQKAVGFGFAQPEYLANDTDLEHLRQDPRFAPLQQKVEALASKRMQGMQAVQAYTPTTERRSARVAFFSQKGSPGQLCIDYGPVAWKAEYDKAIDSPKLVGKKWRLGCDFWTTLDSSLDLQIGGVLVPAGYYYLTATSLGGGKFVLGVHDAAAVKQQHLDAYVADQIEGGIEVPLSHAAADDVADQLRIAIELVDGKHTEGALKIHFGGHELTAPVKIKL